MRRTLRLVGNLLFGVGLGGLALVVAAASVPELDLQRQAPSSLKPTPAIAVPTDGSVASYHPWPTPPNARAAPSSAATARVDDPTPTMPTPGPEPVPAPQPSSVLQPTPTPSPWLPVTRVQVPGIDLESEVVPSHLIERDDGATWEVPAFKAGHAEYTAGAGGLGNAVLLGHVTSLNSGNVFRDLNHVQVGDLVRIFSETQQFDYRVTEVRTVPRTDVSVLEATETATVSLITCTGAWLPLERDYAERLVVRGELLPGAGEPG